MRGPLGAQAGGRRSAILRGLLGHDRNSRAERKSVKRFKERDALFGIEYIAATGQSATYCGGDSGYWVKRFYRNVGAESEIYAFVNKCAENEGVGAAFAPMFSNHFYV